MTSVIAALSSVFAAEGLPDELTVGIPSSFVFNPGESYDLWLAGKNSCGTGPKGPVVVWVP